MDERAIFRAFSFCAFLLDLVSIFEELLRSRDVSILF